jgi:hypothetical protein
MLAASNTLPDNAGYVAAAYLVFLALLLVYVGIMAYKLVKIQRDVVEIDQLADRALEDPATPGGSGAGPTRPREETPA